MDEPFGALDAMTRDVLHDELERLWRETHLTVMFVTHNVREAVRLGDRVVLLSSRPGRIVREYPVTTARPRRIDSPRCRRSRLRSPTICVTRCAAMAVHDRELTQLSTGLDALETVSALEITRGRKLWNATWPKLLAVAIVLGFWQFLIWVHWRPEYAFAPPSKVFASLWNNWSVIWQATTKTLSRAFQGYALALAIGVGLGALVSRIAVLRAAIGSMITGLQTMPSVAWFPRRRHVPLVRRLDHFRRGARRRTAIANGLINGVDNISPVLLRAGRVMGARRLAAFWHVILPAALPSFVGGLKQGWAFAWRSLLAAEVIGGIPGFSLGQQLQAGRDFGKVEDVMAVMIVIFVIGVLMDSFVFGFAERSIRTRYGLVDQALAA